MKTSNGPIRMVIIVVLLVFIGFVLYLTSVLTGRIPNRIDQRLKELNIQLLDGKHTLRDLAFHRFFMPNYLKELKKFNALRKDEILTKCLNERRNILLVLTLSFVAFLGGVFCLFYFRLI